MKAPETVVTQEDRDAAADAVKAYRGQKNGDWQARIRRGEADDGEMVQAFARHRIAHRPPPLQSGEIGEHAGSLFEAIKHGDADHRAWLKDAIAAHFAGKPVPQPRGQGNKEATITALQAELASARKVVEAARDYVEEAAGSPPLYSKEARATVTANANAELKRIDAWLTANGGE